MKSPRSLPGCVARDLAFSELITPSYHHIAITTGAISLLLFWETAPINPRDFVSAASSKMLSLPSSSPSSVVPKVRALELQP